MQEITSAGGKAKAVELDVSASQDEIAKGIKEAWEAFGHLDILVSADFTVKKYCVPLTRVSHYVLNLIGMSHAGPLWSVCMLTQIPLIVIMNLVPWLPHLLGVAVMVL
jgi:hypothetical protein